MRSFFEFPFSLVAQTLVAQPVDRWAKKAKSLNALYYKIKYLKVEYNETGGNPARWLAYRWVPKWSRGDLDDRGLFEILYF
jgi:hypothetical protein